MKLPCPPKENVFLEYFAVRKPVLSHLLGVLLLLLSLAVVGGVGGGGGIDFQAGGQEAEDEATNEHQSIEALPVLVPEGETIKDLDINTLLDNIDRCSSVISVAFSPDGKTLASGSSDDTIRLWDIASGRLFQTLQGHTAWVTSVSFSPDGKTLASGSEDNTIRLWDVSNIASGRLFQTLQGHTSVVTSVSFSPDGKTLASGSWDDTIRLWDISTGRLFQTLEGHTGDVTSVSFSPDGKTLASGSRDETIRLWDISTGRLLKTLQGHTGDVTSVSFSPDGKTLASGSLDKTIRLWDISTGRLFQTLQGHTENVTSVSFCPDGKTLASGSEDNTIRLWDISTGRLFQTLQEHTNFVNSVSFSPDGKTLASGSLDKTTRLWDISTGRLIQTLLGHTGDVTSVSFSPDGKTLTSGSTDATIRLWDISTGRLFQTLQGHTAWVTSVSFSPDGKILASGSGLFDNTIRLWGISTGRQIKTLEGHTWVVTSLSFCPDGNILASGSEDNSIYLWDIPTGRQIQTLQGHTGNVTSVSFSPDGKTLASGSYDNTIRLWDMGNSSSQLQQVFIGGANDNWLRMDGKGRIWRGDDGTLLVKRNHEGKITPVFPPKPKGKSLLEIIAIPSALTTFDGEVTPFTMRLKNTGSAPIYWIKIQQDPNTATATSEKKESSPLVFYSPRTHIKLEPGEETVLNGAVSTYSPYSEPVESENKLHLIVSNAFGEPIPVVIPVEARVPQLELSSAVQQKQDRQVLLVSIVNTGNQDITGETEFTGGIGDMDLDKVTRRNIKVGENFELSFAIPLDKEPGDEPKLTLTAKKTGYPIHEWVFNDIPITFYSLPWYWYLQWPALFIAIILIIYYLRSFMHPLTRQLSNLPGSLLSLPAGNLAPALRLLKRTRRLDTVLRAAGVPLSRLQRAIAFQSSAVGAPGSPGKRCEFIGERLGTRCEQLQGEPLPVYQAEMPRDFILNMDRCLLVFPPTDLPGDEVLSQLKRDLGPSDQVCIFFCTSEEQQQALQKSTLNPDNPYVTPGSQDITQLLLSPTPLDVFARIIAAQVKVTRLSPYRTGGGVEKDSVFFGREHILAHILQREPANYLLVGGRKMGKSSLLKAIERRCRQNIRIHCHYLVLHGPGIAAELAGALELPFDTPLDMLLEKVGREKDKPHWFLIDEVDEFIAAETRSGCKTLQLFRSLSEKGRCYFILAGFWELYRSAVFDYHSPIKNFGETLTVEALEEDACRSLATKPMSLLNFEYENEQLIETLVQKTGQRANLVVVTCNEILKALGMKDRVITQDHLAAALDSAVLRRELGGWEEITKDDEANRLDRIIVYATIERESFTLPQLLSILAGCAAGTRPAAAQPGKSSAPSFSYNPEKVRQSLERLELSYIVKRVGKEYFFPVPIFKAMIRDLGAAELLAGELE